MSNYFENGLHIERNVFNSTEVLELKNAFYETLKICDVFKEKFSVLEEMENTVHHVLFLNKLFQKHILNKKINMIISDFFDQKKFILNSFGGNNNLKRNYASNIHRDVRFYSLDKLMLNTIWCISDINKDTGGTEILLDSQKIEKIPDANYFEKNKIILNAKAGDVVFFDSRLWHKAGNQNNNVSERIIFTPIYSRPFIKPGFNYCMHLNSNSNEFTDNELLKQLCGYYSDIPSSHNEWYNFKNKRYYLKDQDL